MTPDGDQQAQGRDARLARLITASARAAERADAAIETAVRIRREARITRGDMIEQWERGY